jgi:hypothetical protein
MNAICKAAINSEKEGLNADQEKLSIKLNKWLDNFQPGSFLLDSRSGTGKTYTVSRALRHKNLFLAAPTHRALKEFTGRLNCENYATTHSLLSAQPTINIETGNLEFITGEGKEIDKSSIIVIDEVGMLCKEHVYKIESIYKDYKRLYLGDSEQLPPVKENLSKIFNIKHQAYGSLTKIERYSGEILEYAENILNNCFTTPDSIIDLRMNRTWKSLVKSGVDCKLLAYTNKAVDSWNFEARATVNGIENSEKYDWVDNDPIILKAPMLTNSMDEPTKFHTNESGVIYNVTEGVYQLGKLEFPIYYASIHFTDMNEHLHNKRLMSHELIQAFATWKKHIVEGVAENKFDNPGRVWSKYFRALDDFVQCKHNYAATVHSTQGATICHVFVDTKDISTCKNKATKKALLYTGITRCSESLATNS